MARKKRILVNKNALSKVYYNVKHPFSYADAKTLKKAFPKIPLKILRSFLKSQPAYTQHKARRFAFRRSKMQALTIDEIWQSDLLDLPILKSYNNGCRFVLLVQDVFSKFIWLYSLKNKTSNEIIRAFKNIFKTRTCNYMATDGGSEFISKPFKDLLNKYGIRSYLIYSDKKACMVERLVRTIKNKIFRIITKTGDLNYVKKLGDIAQAYNSRPHSTTGIAPKDVNKNNESEIWEKVYGNIKLEGKPKLKVGDIVRLAVTKKVFDKSYMGTYTKEEFIVDRIITRDPCLYIVRDMDGNIIKGGFYFEELVKTSE